MMVGFVEVGRWREGERGEGREEESGRRNETHELGEKFSSLEVGTKREEQLLGTRGAGEEEVKRCPVGGKRKRRKGGKVSSG